MNPIESLTDPVTLYSRPEILSKPSPVPAMRGVYSWFFKEIPANVPTDGCITKNGLTLLYVGISPKNSNSRQNLKRRITDHFRGNAEGSTLRLTLGVLLVQESDFPLRRVGSGKRKTFTHAGEQWLDNWMEKNAFVCWVEHPAPWELELELLKSLSLPLNIKDNHHPFSIELSNLRKEAGKLAREEPIEREDGQQRRISPVPYNK
jgi:hypothetical protein